MNSKVLELAPVNYHYRYYYGYYYYVFINMIICYHLIIGCVSSRNYILGLSFSCATGHSSICVFLRCGRFLCFECETNILQHYHLSSLDNFQLSSILQKLSYISSHLQCQTVCLTIRISNLQLFPFTDSCLLFSSLSTNAN